MIVNAGLISHADPIRNLYKIDPALGRTNERVSVIFATVLGVGGISTKAVHIPTYQVGDCVLYVMDEGASNIKISAWAIILGTYPGGLETNVSDITNYENKEFSPLYNELTKLLGYDKDFSKRGFIHNWSRENKGTDYIVSSPNILLNINDYDVSLRSKHAGLYINSVDQNFNVFGVTHGEEFINKSTKSIIVNNNPYEHTLFFDQLTVKNNRRILRYDQHSPLVGGNKSTVLVNNTPIISTESNNDGVIKLKSINGVIIDKDIDIPFIKPTYTASVNLDEKLTTDIDILKEDNVPDTWGYYNGKPSDLNLWDSSALGNKSFGREAPYPVKDVEKIPYTQTKARIAALPDGSIVLRDAWGSEIRMKDGDIQLSAANKITLLSSSDILNLCGGIFSTNAIKGIQLGTEEGNIETLGNATIIKSKAQTTLHSEESLNLLSSNEVNCAGSILTINSKDILANSQGNLTLTAASISALSSNRFILGNEYSAIDGIGNTITISSTQTTLYSNVKLDKGSYDSGELVNKKKIKSSAGERYINISGSAILDGYLHVNKNISTSELVAAHQVAAKDTNLGGIYGLRKKPKEISLDKKDLTVPNSSDIHFDDRINKKLDLNGLFSKLALQVTGVYSFLATFFTKNKNDIAIFKPVFGVSGLAGKNMNPASVDISGKKRYIYPGEFFWNTSGLKTQNPIDVEDLKQGVNTTYSGVNSLNVEK